MGDSHIYKAHYACVKDKERERARGEADQTLFTLKARGKSMAKCDYLAEL